GIRAVIDRNVGEVLRVRPRGDLWGMTFQGGCDSFAQNGVQVAYSWNGSTGVLTAHVTEIRPGATPSVARIAYDVSRTSSADLRLTFENRSGCRMDAAHFPSDLLLDDAAVSAAYVPSYLPGVRLKAGFFRDYLKSCRYDNHYPGGAAFADFLAFDF